MLNNNLYLKILDVTDMTISGSPASFKHIDDFEKRLRVTLPESYKNFLLNIGTFAIKDGWLEIFGLNSKIEKIESKKGGYFDYDRLGVKNKMVDDIRNSWGYEYLKEVQFIPFYWLGNGDYLIINLHKYNSETKEAPVELFKHEVLHEYEGKKADFSKRNKITEETGFGSFGEWLEQLVEDNFEVPLWKKGFIFEEFEEEDCPDTNKKSLLSKLFKKD